MAHVDAPFAINVEANRQINAETKAWVEADLADRCRVMTSPTLLVHGAYDDLMSFDGGYRHGAAYLGVERTLKNLATRNGCLPDSLRKRSADSETTTFSPKNCAADTEILRIDDYGHTWFEAPEAERVAVDFFLRQG